MKPIVWVVLVLQQVVKVLKGDPDVNLDAKAPAKYSQGTSFHLAITGTAANHQRSVRFIVLLVFLHAQLCGLLHVPAVSSGGHPGVVEALLSVGANASIKNAREETPLAMAIDNRNLFVRFVLV